MTDFVTWTTIPVLVKQFILEYLDYDSRCNLKLCSKDNKTLVESTKYVADSISFGEQPGNYGNNSTIFLRFETKIIELTDKNEVTKLKFGSMEREIKGNRYDVAKRWIDKISDNGKIEARKIQILNLSLEPSENWVLKCEELKIRMIGQQKLSSWLQKTIPKLKKLDIQEWRIDGIFEMEQVKNTSEFVKLSRNVSISDEQLERIRAPSIVIHSDDNTITVEGAKKAFQKYVENSKDGDRFELRFSKPEDFDHKTLFVNDWIMEHGPSDGTEEEYIYRIIGGFINVHGVQQIPNVIIYDFSSYMTLKAFHFIEPILFPSFV